MTVDEVRRVLSIIATSNSTQKALATEGLKVCADYDETLGFTRDERIRFDLIVAILRSAERIK